MTAMLIAGALLSLPLALAQEKSVWFSYFQDHCRACDRQLQELDCLKEQGWTVIPVGIGNHALALQKVLRRYVKTEMKMQVLSQEEAKLLGLIGTPIQEIFLNGENIKRRLGLVYCSPQTQPSFLDRNPELQNIPLQMR